ncbi:hypothetical protein P175DRAFT_0529110 [Aspergillus ochraceoroseus IBT 24754]|uniref:Protein kinase domain-containing protein n=1 Tax=Aspergillus ochraceoroseus IBT 24754 TaxID=1392256 RepID=A0A2T5MAI3_9EURO|nr:uncharacterized protein P175DRAFT_0529110 [Aspergillus ochraceoroseus IBT 24754]PTU25552.1 hypothetical protein P175DRAFT_0529110 [Aspergillus ochraceoroseus IBT 24754]
MCVDSWIIGDPIIRVIPNYPVSQYGIELALAQGDLEFCLQTYPIPEREDSFKINWLLSLIETLCKVFVDDIALRNILILDEQLKLADFGQLNETIFIQGWTCYGTYSPEKQARLGRDYPNIPINATFFGPGDPKEAILRVGVWLA